MKAREKDQRRDWILIVLIILIGLFCILCAGSWALRLNPRWSLDSSMDSHLDPNSDFLTRRPLSLIEPIDISVLTQPAGVNLGLYLTPGASFQTGTPAPTSINNTQIPPTTQTPIATLINATPTGIPPTIIPTDTSIFLPPTPTRTNSPVAPSANLQITVSDGSLTYMAGGTITYTIVVSHAGGTVNANGATVVDNFPAVLSGITWTCTGIGGATCPANGAGNINSTVNLPVGSSVTFTVNANISPAANGNLVNTASVTSPVGVPDPAPANNTATDTDTPVILANLQITKTDGSATYVPGTATTYTIVVSNAGPANVTGATVIDTFPALINNAAWSCVAAGGAACTAANGVGNINHIVNIPTGGSLTYTVNATILASATGNLVNTASVTPPAVASDPVPANNTATDTDTPVYNVNLQITKTDGVATYSPGTTTTYTIVVSNAGPANVTGATVTDIFPAQITGVNWTCVAAGGAACFAVNGIGNLNHVVNIPAGGSLTYTAVANISAAALGNLVNTATVAAPGGYTETAPGNNSATDTDTIAINADLGITKTSPTTSYTTGSSVSYTIVVTNNGPNNVTGATVTDTFPPQVTGVNWTCVAAGGAACFAANGTGNINHVVNIPAGGSLTYTAVANISAAALGNLVNTADVTAPVGVTDPAPGNNSATYTHIPLIDLQITKTDGSLTYVSGGTVTYTVTVTNNSTFDLTGITVDDPIPSLVTTWGWCVAPCAPAANTAADLGDTINLTAGASITYSILANIHPSAAGNLDNTADVTAPAGYTDAVPGNNSATDSDINQTGEPEVGTPDGGVYSLPDNGSVTFYLSQPIVANGDAAAEFVFYELQAGMDILLDQIAIEISMDGVTWYRVFFWGDGIADTNTNVDNVNLPNIAAACPTEADNCQIAITNLYNGNSSGITIDVDNSPLSVVPLGNYYWIRFIEPGITPGDGAHVDSIFILP